MPDPSDSVEFAVTRGIGRDLTVPGGGLVDHAPYTTGAGFRQCNCYRAGVLWSFEDCLRPQRCINDRSAYSTSQEWKPITVSTKGMDAKPAFSNDLAHGATLTNRLFTSVVKTTGSIYDPGRVGEREHLAWRWWKDLDIQNGPVTSYLENGTRKTAGIFWSHTLNDGVVASQRDQQYNRRLRDSYAYVTTPLYRAPWQDVIQLPSDFAEICSGHGCGPWLRVELWRPRPPEEVLDDSLLGRLDGPARLVANSGRVLLARDLARPVADVTDRVPPTLSAMLGAGTWSWLSPVEREDRTYLHRDATHLVALPRDWQQTSRVTPVFATESGFALRGIDMIDAEPVAMKATTSSEPMLRFVPRARTGARSLLTLTERSIYMLGGRADGVPTGEIWRYDLDANAWKSAFGRTAPRPADVLAAGYDYKHRKLLVLDEREPALGSKQARLILYDTALNTGSVLAIFPRSGFYDKFALVGREDGTFLLLAARQGKTDVFRLGVQDGQLTWRGYDKLQGSLIDEPIYTTRGVVVPLARAGKLVLQTVTDAMLHGHHGCNKL